MRYPGYWDRQETLWLRFAYPRNGQGNAVYFLNRPFREILFDVSDQIVRSVYASFEIANNKDQPQNGAYEDSLNGQSKKTADAIAPRNITIAKLVMEISRWRLKRRISDICDFAVQVVDNPLGFFNRRSVCEIEPEEAFPKTFSLSLTPSKKIHGSPLGKYLTAKAARARSVIHASLL